MDKTTKLLKVKRVGNSWDIRLTPAFAQANNLQDGDYVALDMSKLKVIKAEDFEGHGREPVLEVAR
jgi:antitoxin component of MazEF toxin-antitoxin module